MEKNEPVPITRRQWLYTPRNSRVHMRKVDRRFIVQHGPLGAWLLPVVIIKSPQK